MLIRNDTHENGVVVFYIRRLNSEALRYYDMILQPPSLVAERS